MRAASSDCKLSGIEKLALSLVVTQKRFVLAVDDPFFGRYGATLDQGSHDFLDEERITIGFSREYWPADCPGSRESLIGGLRVRCSRNPREGARDTSVYRWRYSSSATVLICQAGACRSGAKGAYEDQANLTGKGQQLPQQLD